MIRPPIVGGLDLDRGIRLQRARQLPHSLLALLSTSAAALLAHSCDTDPFDARHDGLEFLHPVGGQSRIEVEADVERNRVLKEWQGRHRPLRMTPGVTDGCGEIDHFEDCAGARQADVAVEYGAASGVERNRDGESAAESGFVDEMEDVADDVDVRERFGRRRSGVRDR